MAEVVAKANSIVAHMPPVKKAVKQEATQMAREARKILRKHRKTGTARIRVTRGKVDSFVTLEDEAATAIEFGHATEDGKEVQGLYVLHKAMGKAGA